MADEVVQYKCSNNKYYTSNFKYIIYKYRFIDKIITYVEAIIIKEEAYYKPTVLHDKAMWVIQTMDSL